MQCVSYHDLDSTFSDSRFASNLMLPACLPGMTLVAIFSTKLLINRLAAVWSWPSHNVNCKKYKENNRNIVIKTTSSSH